MAGSAVAAPPTGRINWLLSATGIAVIGQGMALTAAPLLAADLSRNPVAVSAVTAATYAAVLLIGLPAGALVDRWQLRRVMVATDLSRFVLLALFAGLLAVGFGSVSLLVVLVFLVGVGNSFFDPAAQAAIPGVVGRDPTALARANGRMWGLDTFGRGLVGPPLGAAAFAASTVLPFGLQSVAFFISAVLLLPLGEPRPRVEASARSLRAEIRDGVTFLAGQGKLRALTLGTAVYNFCYNLGFAPFVLFAQDRLGLASIGYGALISVSAVGGILGGWVGSWLARHLPPFRVIAAALATQALAWFLIVLVQNPVVAAAGMLLLGLASTTVSVVVGATRQMLTPDDMLGRVVSVARVLGVGSAAVGALVGGGIAQLTGQISAPLVAAGVLLAAAVIPFAVARQAG